MFITYWQALDKEEDEGLTPAVSLSLTHEKEEGSDD